MKKLISFTIFCLLSWAYSITNAQTKFGLLGGINFQNLNGKNSQGDKLNNDLIVGFHIGANAQIPIAPEFYFQPGLLFSTKGAAKTQNSISTKSRISYIEVPLNFVYKGALGSGFIMLGFGPYMGYAVDGKYTLKNNGTTNTYDFKFQNSIDASDPTDKAYLRAFDAGANIFAGYELAGGIFFQLNSQLGLVNISPKNELVSNDKTVLKNTGFGLSAGYRF